MKARLGLEYLALQKIFNEGHPTHVYLNIQAIRVKKKE